MKVSGQAITSAPGASEKKTEMSNPLDDLLGQPLVVVNVGLEGFAEELAGQGVEVVQVAWQPPAGGDPDLADLLSRLGG